MSYLISYDITKNSLRSRVGNYLIANGFDRIQYSVYLGTVAPKVVLEVRQWLKAQIPVNNPDKDSIIMIPLMPFQIQSMTIIGDNKLDIPDLSGTKNTSIF